MTNILDSILDLLDQKPATEKEISERMGVQNSICGIIIEFLLEYDLVRRDGSKFVSNPQIKGLSQFDQKVKCSLEESKQLEVVISLSR